MTPLIYALRTAKNFTQAELAKRCGLSRQTINSIEVGNSVPTLASAFNIARALDVPTEDLYLQPGAEAAASTSTQQSQESGAAG